jgi:hypothetical protein
MATKTSAATTRVVAVIFAPVHQPEKQEQHCEGCQRDDRPDHYIAENGFNSSFCWTAPANCFVSSAEERHYVLSRLGWQDKNC